MLSINENTLNALAYSGQIPHLRASAGGSARLCFSAQEIDNWLGNGSAFKTNGQAYVMRLKRRLPKRYPEAYAALQELNKQFIEPRKPKGYSLAKVANKKLGFVYYVRYIEKGKLVATRWSTHTNNPEAATRFAIENRDKLLAEYRRKKAGKKMTGSLYAIMRRYYEKGSPYQKTDARRGRSLSEQARNAYHNSILNHWIPFLKKQRINSLDEINTPLLVRFQDYCMDKGIKPQTVNHYAGFVSHIFDYLVLRGCIAANPCDGLTALGVKEEDNEIRGCYSIAGMRGMFNKRWGDEISYLLCLVIYSTGMRNSEMDRIKVKDIIRIGGCRFINIPKSKTRYGARLVPLHDFVYGKLVRYIGRHKKGPEDLLFCQANGKALPRQRYTNANLALGKIAGYDKARLENEHITFYSGRHFWKTMMNAGGLGEVEEYFMGHKVSNDVAKRYNHRDKQGQEKIVRKAREAFRILDKILLAPRR